MNSVNVPLYSCRSCGVFLEEGNFYYTLDIRNGTPFLFCGGCKEDGEKFRDGKITEEEFRNSMRNRLENARNATFATALEMMKKGWPVGFINAKGAKTTSCCQLSKLFDQMDHEAKTRETTNFTSLLDGMNKQGNLCANCSKFCDNIRKNFS